jgi:hypothetical protein
MTREITEQGTRYLGISMGEIARGTALTRILALKTVPGWHVQGKAVKEWRFVGMTEQEKTVYLYGPLESGTTLEEVLSLPFPKALPFFARLAESLALLSERSVPWFPLQTDAILFTSGGVLFLPPTVFQELRDIRPFEQNRDTWESITHPDLKGESRASFAIASMLYRVITGRFPIEGKDAEELHEQARKLDILPPVRVVPEIAPEVSALVMAGLGRARRGPVRMDEWASELEAWKTKDLYRVLGAEEKEKAERDGQAIRQQSERGFKRRVFWQRNWKLIGIITVVVAVVGVIGGSMAKNILAPRVTRGYPPQKVVQAFYTAMNTLDQTTMEACVVNHAGQGEINEVTTLFVTSRVVLGYEGKSNIVSAADWEAQGHPDLVSPQTLYGVTALSVTQEQGEPDPVFLVKYDKWNPAPPTDTAAAPDLNAIPLSEGHAVQDRVFLRKDRNDWVMYRIDTIQSNLLPAPKAVAAAPVSPSQQLLPMGGQ